MRRFLVVLGQFRHMGRVEQGGLEGVVQLLHDARLHAARSDQTIGRHGDDAVAQFLERRRLRPALGARLAQGGQQAQLARIDIGRKAGGVDAGHQLARGDGQHLLGGAFVGHVDVAQLALAEQFVKHDVRCGAQAVGRNGQLAWLGGSELEQVFDRFERAVERHHDTEGDAGQLDDRRGVADRIPGQFLHMRRAQRRLRQLRQGVAIGRGLLQDRHGQGAAGARPVFDDDALAQGLARDVAQQAHRDIGGAASRPGHDQNDRPRRKGRLRPGRYWHAGCTDRGQQFAPFHGGLPRLASCPKPRCGS